MQNYSAAYVDSSLSQCRRHDRAVLLMMIGQFNCNSTLTESKIPANGLAKNLIMFAMLAVELILV